MELVFSRKDMVRAIQMVSRVSGKPNILPVLSHVLLSAGHHAMWDMSEGFGMASPTQPEDSNGDRIYVAATDMEVGMRTGIPGQIVEGGAIAIPARTLASVVNALSQDELKLVTSGNRATIRCESGEFRIAGMPGHEFPSLVDGSGQDEQLELADGTGDSKVACFISLNPDALGWMMRKTAYAASRDADRYFLNGVRLSLTNGLDGNWTRVRMAATDGVRLAVADAVIEEQLEKDVNVTIPNRAARELEKLTIQKDAVRIGFQGNRMLFHMGDTTLVSALLEDEYPDYERVIPTDTRIKLKVDTAHLLSAVRRMAQVADPKTPAVRLEATGSRLRLSASCPYIGDGCEEVNVDHEGDDIQVAIDARYLMDALRAIETQETLMGMNGEVQPVVIEPSSVQGQPLSEANGQSPGEHLCVLMPMRVADSC